MAFMIVNHCLFGKRNNHLSINTRSLKCAVFISLFVLANVVESESRKGKDATKEKVRRDSEIQKLYEVIYSGTEEELRALARDQGFHLKKRVCYVYLFYTNLS